jgi:non-ribosomal peptide synthetase component F
MAIASRSSKAKCDTRTASCWTGHVASPGDCAVWVSHGDRVSVLAPNSSPILKAHLETHFGVPWSGGVLNALKLIDQAVPDMVAVEGENSPLAPYHMSGTAGRPKGVMNSHRGAYSQALAMASHTGLDARSRYLWTLPMFHSNG